MIFKMTKEMASIMNFYDVTIYHKYLYFVVSTQITSHTDTSLLLSFSLAYIICFLVLFVFCIPLKATCNGVII